jgi:serine protease SohB
MMPRRQLGRLLRRERKERGARPAERRRVFVIDFRGDIRATGVAALREEVSAVLSEAGAADEVLVRLENAGGLVHEHGLAASQLARVRDRGVPLTVAVDKVAASGGYLMASVADRILAAPFAVVGSIGVLAQVPNFHRLLERHGVDFEQVKAGQFKRTVTLFGETTEEDRAKLREQVEETQGLLKEFIRRYRPGLDLERVSTGEYWHGTQALELGLVDELTTSDDYMIAVMEEADVYKVRFAVRKRLSDRMISAVRSAAAPRFLDS